MKEIVELCPTKDFETEKSEGKCWGVGHHCCHDCKNYREDFKIGGQQYIDYCHNVQAFTITVL